MPFSSRSSKFTLYKLTEHSFDNLYPENMRDDVKFEPIDDTRESASIGFSCFDDFMQPIGAMPVDKGSYLCLAIRFDRRNIPAALFKKHFLAEIERVKEERQIPKIGRAHKLEIKERVKLDLLGKTLPVPSSTDVVIDMTSGLVMVCTCKGGILEWFETVIAEMNIGKLTKVDISSLCEEKDTKATDTCGTDFLTWLFYDSMQSQDNSPEDYGLWSAWKAVTLEHENGDKVSIVDQNLNFREGLQGLCDGKVVTKLSLSFTHDKGDFLVNIDSDFSITINTPVIITEKVEGDDPDAIFYEKVYLVEFAISQVQDLVNRFIVEYQNWPAVQVKIADWAAGTVDIEIDGNESFDIDQM